MTAGQGHDTSLPRAQGEHPWVSQRAILRLHDGPGLGHCSHHLMESEHSWEQREGEGSMWSRLMCPWGIKQQD